MDRDAKSNVGVFGSTDPTVRTTGNSNNTGSIYRRVGVNYLRNKTRHISTAVKCRTCNIVSEFMHVKLCFASKII